MRENEDIPPRPVVVPPPVSNDKYNDVIEEEIIDFPDVAAEFTGGASALQRWVSVNVRYPLKSIENNEQGRVYLSFVVETDGSLTNIRVERGVSELLDREAKRIVRSMPRWIPGEVKGMQVRTHCRLPINFTISED